MGDIRFIFVIGFILFVVLFLLIKAFSIFFKKVERVSDSMNIIHTIGGSSYMNRNCNFGDVGNNIDFDDLDFFREIPTNDIFRAYWIIYNYKLGSNDEDILLAVFLKWIRDGNIKLVDENLDGSKKVTNIVFIKAPSGEVEIEMNLYNYMKSASIGNNIDGKIDNKLTKDEFKEWCVNNYSSILGWFSSALDYEIMKLIKEERINVRKINSPSGVSKYQLSYDVDPLMFEEAKKVAGLKKFLMEFSLIDSKEPLEVKLWDTYLMYAAMFGIADKVSKQLEEYCSDFDDCIESITFIRSIMSEGVKDAKIVEESYRGLINKSYSFDRDSSNMVKNDVLKQVSNYHFGGGGFSSGGGGGGSFGGGSGGGGFR